MRRLNPRASVRASLTLLVWTSVLATEKVAADNHLFDIVDIPTQGRVVAARFADFNGDRRQDLMTVTLQGRPPTEDRKINVYLQTPDGWFSDTADHSIAVPYLSSVYDIADLKDTPGKELVILRPDGVTLLSVADPVPTQWDLPVAGPTTVGASEDERGFESFPLVFWEFSDTPWILVPQIGQITAITADGEVKARLEVGRRANFFVANSNELISVESDIQLFLDVPKISIGDVDGNGLADVVSATRHEIDVFLQDVSGDFPAQPSFRIPLEFINESDQIRGSGSLVTTARDIYGTGRLDLMITHVEGSFTDTVTTTYLYRNQGRGWNISEPDESFVSKGTLSSDLLVELDEAPGPELMRVQLKFSVLEVVELLLTRKLDVRIDVYKRQENGRFGEKPWSKKKFNTALNFETFRPKGFMPITPFDLNGDGSSDFITSANGNGLEVYLGDDRGPFSKRLPIQKFPSAGLISFSDFDGDGLSDFVLFDPQSVDSPIRVGRNLFSAAATGETG